MRFNFDEAMLLDAVFNEYCTKEELCNKLSAYSYTDMAETVESLKKKINCEYVDLIHIFYDRGKGKLLSFPQYNVRVKFEKSD